MELFSGSRCYSWNEKIPSSDPILESAGLNFGTQSQTQLLLRGFYLSSG